MCSACPVIPGLQRDYKALRGHWGIAAPGSTHLEVARAVPLDVEQPQVRLRQNRGISVASSSSTGRKTAVRKAPAKAIKAAAGRKRFDASHGVNIKPVGGDG